MLSAEQVREKQLAYQNSVVEEDLELIEQAIEKAIKGYQKSAYHYNALNPETINRLRELGYKVSTTDYHSETTVTISW